MKLKFCGATGRVTGSSFLLKTNTEQILIDCGLFQGSSAERGKNHEPFPFDPKKIDFVLATHSHIDHIGRIPKLVREGFSGKIYSTEPVKDFAELFLADTFKLMREEAKKHGPERLIWEKADLDKALTMWETFDYHEPFNVGGSIAEFLDAGHILGSAMIKIISEGKSIIFSGDVGNPPAPIVEDPEKVDQADYVVLETTYGDRVHAGSGDRVKELENILREIEERNGVLLIPAFAMERTQELLYEIDGLVNDGKISRKIKFFLDSPLAIKATRVYNRYPQYFDSAALAEVRSGNNVFDFPGLIVTEKPTASNRISSERSPKVIIAGAGMSTGGRILGHEQAYLPDPNNIILFIGYQVKGTLGRQIKDGQRFVKINGREVEVRAEIREISAYSSHADQPKLVQWIENVCKKGVERPRVFAVHGEPVASQAFAEILRKKVGIDAYVPIENEEVEL